MCERFVADGAGKIIVTDTVQISGMVVRLYTHTGRYSVNADCTGGTLMMDSVAYGGIVNYDFFFNAAHTALVFIGSDSGATITGTATR